MKGKHSSFRQIRKTAEGTYLVSQQNGKQGSGAREYDSNGKLIKRFPGGRFAAIRLPNSNTLLSCGDQHKLIEVDKNNNVVWTVEKNDIPTVSFGFIAGIQRLANGNTIITNWTGHKAGDGGAVVEITKDKELVWKTPFSIKSLISTVHVIDKELENKTALR